jgi:hypothetical protein
MTVKSNSVMDNNIKYVILRDGRRVSDLEYTSKDEAKTEYDHWYSIIKRWPDGSKIEIVEMKGK